MVTPSQATAFLTEIRQIRQSGEIDDHDLAARLANEDARLKRLKEREEVIAVSLAETGESIRLAAETAEIAKISVAALHEGHETRRSSQRSPALTTGERVSSFALILLAVAAGTISAISKNGLVQRISAFVAGVFTMGAFFLLLRSPSRNTY